MAVDSKALADVLLSVADAMLQMDARLKTFTDSTSLRLTSIEQRLSLVEAQQTAGMTAGAGKEQHTQATQAHEVWKSRNEQSAPLRTAAAATTCAPSRPSSDGSLERAIAYFEDRLRELRAQSKPALPHDTPSEQTLSSSHAKNQNQDISQQEHQQQQQQPSRRVQEWLSAASTLDVSDDSVQVGEYLNSLLKQRRATTN